MKNKENATHHHYVKHSESIKTICKPLQEHFDITSFVYQKNLNNGAEVRLTNQPAWLEHFLSHELYKLSGFEKNPKNYRSGHVIWSHLTHHQPILNAAREFKIDHGMTLINKTDDGCEFVFFGTTPDNYHLVNFYLNNIDLLQRFLIYFKDKAAPIISDLEKQQLYIPNKYQDVVSAEHGIPTLSDDFKKLFLQNIKINTTILNGIKFSSRELDCARLLLQGKTAKEIGEGLFISPRTVDTHIVHLKEKLQCRTKSELIAKLIAVTSNQFL